MQNICFQQKSKKHGKRNKTGWYLQGKKELTETVHKKTQLLHLLDKDFKSTALKMHKKSKNNMNKELKETRKTMT